MYTNHFKCYLYLRNKFIFLKSFNNLYDEMNFYMLSYLLFTNSRIKRLEIHMSYDHQNRSRRQSPWDVCVSVTRTHLHITIPPPKPLKRRIRHAYRLRALSHLISYIHSFITKSPLSLSPIAYRFRVTQTHQNPLQQSLCLFKQTMMQPAPTGVAPPQQTQQQQYPHQPYMMIPPQPQPGAAVQAPPQMWAPQPPSAQQQQPQIQAQQPTSAEEVRTLWIGDLQYWMDENYLFTCFAQTGEVQYNLNWVLFDL